MILNSCTLTGNKANESNGGAVFMGKNGFVTANNTSFTNNSSVSGSQTVSGGAIFAYSLSLRACSISGNSADSGGGLCLGTSASGATTLLINESTISGNSGGGTGGGMIISGDFAAGALTIRNSTISGNSGGGTGGGGIRLFAMTGELIVQNSTITNNTANSGSNGGGIRNNSGTGTISLESTIVSGNVNSGAPDISSTNIVKLKNSAVGSNTGFTMTDLGGNLAFGTNLLLGSLVSNGGPTQTHQPLPNSPVINAGNNPAGFTSDQRGPGFARVIGSAADIGAVELQPPPCVAGVVINDGSVQRSRVTSIRIDFDQQVTLPVNPINAFQLERISDNALVGLNAIVTSDADTLVTLTFKAGAIETGAGFVAPFSLKDGRYRLTIFANEVAGEGFQLDGDCNGTGGDDFVLTGDPATNGLFRLFGDADGDGTAAANDFIQFRLALGGSTAMFDFDSDGAVGASDFIQFRLRFGGSI